MSTIRFHWDFFGPDSARTAEHFCEHMNEFCVAEGISTYRSFVTPGRMRSVASLECDEAHLVLVRDRLRPKRAERIAAPQ